MLKTEDPEGAELEIVGDYHAELHRLSGAKVRASGEVSEGRFSVSSYEIEDIAGRRPIVGVLQVSDGSTSIVQTDGDRVNLRAAPDELLAQDGAKVWVILDTGGTIVGYGILRER